MDHVFCFDDCKYVSLWSGRRKGTVRLSDDSAVFLCFNWRCATTAVSYTHLQGLAEYCFARENERIRVLFACLLYTSYSDEKTKKEAERAEKAKQRGEKAAKKKAVGSQFFNNLAGLLGDEFMKRGATLHGCDVKTRDAFANMDIAGYNYGIYRYKHDLKKYPQRLILGSETFCNDAYKFREMAKSEPRLVGDFVWAGDVYKRQNQFTLKVLFPIKQK